jgi:hypothetical protein
VAALLLATQRHILYMRFTILEEYNVKAFLTGFLSSATLVVALSMTPALDNGSDARFEADQAQIHPISADQTPDWSSGDVAVGELYPKVPGAAAFYGPNGERPLGSMAVPVRSCPLILDTTNGRETVSCGL